MVRLAVIICVPQVLGRIVAVVDNEVRGDSIKVDPGIVLHLQLTDIWAVPIVGEYV